MLEFSKVLYYLFGYSRASGVGSLNTCWRMVVVYVDDFQY